MIIFPSERNLPEDEWPETLRHEIGCLRCWPAVQEASIAVTTDDSARILVRFQIETDRLIEAKETPIQDLEPIILVYRSIDSVGSTAPLVWSGRTDFPRDIGHINPTVPNSPASICLARAGLQPIYDNLGINGIIGRLSDWFHDAKTGQLMFDGWEPVPAPEGQRTRSALYDAACFQDIAIVRPNGGWTCGIATLFDVNNDVDSHLVVLQPELNLDDQVKLIRAHAILGESPREKGIKAYIPWIFVWGNNSRPIETQTFGVWNSLGEITTGVEGAIAANQIHISISQMFNKLGDEASKDRSGGR